MELTSPEGVHLTYCSKVHPGHGWGQVLPQLEACLPRLKGINTKNFPVNGFLVVNQTGRNL